MLKTWILAFSALLSAILVLQAHSKVISTSKNSDFVLQATKKWLKNTHPFKNCSSDEEMLKSIDDLLSWKTPDYFVKHFPYYFAGLSYEKFPIYIGECGKYDAVALLRQGPLVVENIEKAIVQGIVRGLKFHSRAENGGLDENMKVIGIIDFEGFTYAQYTSVAALETLTRLALQYVTMAEQFVEKVYLINGNYAVDTLYKTFRPLLGQLSERIEIYGPKKSKWLAVLRRELPLDALPPWYGGYGNFTPIATYG